MQTIIEQAAAILCDFIAPDKLWQLQEAETEEEKAAVIYPLLRAYKETMQAADKKFNATEEEIEAAGGAAAIDQAINDRLNSMLDKEEINAAANAIAGRSLTPEKLADMVQTVNDILGSEQYQQMKEFVEETKAAIEAFRTAQGGAKMHAATLAPFLKQVLEEDNSSYDLFDIIDHPKAKKYKAIIARAEEKREQFLEARKAIDDTELLARELPRIINKPIKKITFPLDRPNNIVWDMLQVTESNGQLNLNILTGKDLIDKDISVLYSIDFDSLPPNVKITKKLTVFDKRVYIVMAALFYAGNDIVSVTEIYKNMGNAAAKKKRPNDTDLQKLNDSITKMQAAHIYIDNWKEYKNAKGYTHFKYDGSLLPCERIEAFKNGKLTESAIHIFREPPLITFARERKQIATFPREVLDSPVSKTIDNLTLEDYLIGRIAHMKNARNAPRKILFETIYKNCEITDRMKKSRTPEKLNRYLQHYVNVGWIANYTVESDGVKIEPKSNKKKYYKKG